MITKITGTLCKVHEEEISLDINHFEYEVLVPEFVRRQVQQKLGEAVSLHTIEYIEGNPMQGRMVPRLVGFLSEAEREFFELFCSVDGVGVRKALKALVRPIKDIAVAIQNQDATMLATLPGVGEATAERIIAKLRRKVAKFALMVDRAAGPTAAAAEPSAVEDAFAALISVGHSEGEARSLLDRALTSGKKFKAAGDLLEEIYRLGTGPK
ncbi:MAG: Holliday junction DNA helicase RuvA [Planctomycetes bacterium]|nr:Holliday junction DNA helicase RuvA [Planctomycetota bacterium]